ncbi:hypothetical protein MLD38_029150 [Melastoma candidum]|uniref:Uncharacterized protein n=1 Tax=Melastoma candidum TaxID=119954 RepID=A0ACB9N5C9_9MYRT|nr:hypothetical protein MLD38_029150 [Melastoma candidum]
MKDYDVRCCSPEFWAFLVICVVLVAFAGINSGLALGLLSFGPVDLEVLLKAGQPQERKYAAKILPLVSNEHLLLCALLVGKSLAMEALPLFLDSILPTWAAILVSVTLVLSFTEILPQAICSRYGLSLGAKMSVLVRVLLLIFLPVAYPISKVLDCLLGKTHPALYRRAELKTLVDLHENEAGKGGELSHHETSIIRGALDLTQKTAKDAMTPISETFSLDINSKLDVQTMGLIMSKGHSRVPVYTGQPTNIVGLILVKNLISCRPEDQTPIKFMTIRKIPRVQENWPLYDILALFQKGHSHMAIVHRSNQDDRKTENSKPSPDEDTTCEAKPATMSPLHPHEYSISLLESPVYSTDSDFPSLQLKDVTEQYENLPSPLKKVEKINPPLPLEGLESLPCNLDEEVVGIITMEDIMEELLQKEILDETDEYVDLHNRIRINLALSRGSSRSPRSEARFNRITPDQSQLSTRAVMLRSPIAPYIQPPLPKPILYTSPVSKRIASSGTPLSHKVRVQKLHSNTSALS